MPVQQFVPFATGLGANVEGQSAYILDALRTAGNQRGMASSSLNNKALRQGTFVTAAISQFIADVLNEDVLDNADLAGYEDQFERAIKSYMFRFVRQKLTANTDFYVDINSGVDTNDGSVSRPWKTLQRAWNYIQQQLDLGGFIVTIHVADGAYSVASGVALSASGSIVGQSNASGSIVFIGNAGTPANCVIATSNGNAVNLSNGASLTLNGFKITAGGANPVGFGISAQGASTLSFQNLEFGACGNAQLTSATGSQISLIGNYRISGAAPIHVRSHALGLINLNQFTCTLVGPFLTYSQAFASVDELGLIESVGMSWVGTATGSRYGAGTGGQINTQGSGATYFPGSTAGTVDRADEYA
jgi:hypothetical protein